jgi:hypothetical protein
MERRAFIGAAAWAAGLSLLPGRALAATARQKGYGVVEIRAAAMSVAFYTLDLDRITPSVRRSGFDRMAPQLTGEPFPEAELASPLGPDVDDARAAQAVDIVAGHVEALKTRHGLATEDVSVLVSGGLSSPFPSASRGSPPACRRRPASPPVSSASTISRGWPTTGSSPRCAATR